MLTLGLDTATAWGSVGLWHEKPLAEVAWVRTPRQDDFLLSSLDHALRTSGLKRSALELVAVALGPGSFTSLRVGVCLAKGLALGLGVPLVGVPLLPLYAQRFREEGHTLCALISDRKDRAYAAWFVDGKPQGPVTVLNPETLTSALQTVERPVVLVGPGAKALYRGLSEREGVFLACDATCRPSGVEVAEAGLNKFFERGADDTATLEPLYSAVPAISAPPTNRGDACGVAGVHQTRARHRGESCVDERPSST